MQLQSNTNKLIYDITKSLISMWDINVCWALGASSG